MKYIFLTLFILISCNKNSKDSIDEGENSQIDNIIDKLENMTLSNLEIIEKDSIARLELINSYDSFPKINYTQIIIKDKNILNELFSEYGFSKDNKIKNKVFITLNRKETKYLSVGDTIIVPDTIINDKRAYSIFPHYYPEAKQLDKAIIISNYYQSYACYEFGKLVRFAACNTGKEKTPTFPGRYALVWKDKKRRSSLDSTWIMPFTFNFHRYAGNAFHQFEMPGYAASHSCVRQFLTDAEWLFNWGRGVKVEDGKQIWLSGTPVVIIGVPDYSLRKSGPWSHLKNNKQRPIKLDFNPMEVEEAYIPFVQIPESIRNWIPNKDRYVHAEDTLRKRGIIAQHTTLTPSIDFNKQRREKKLAKDKSKLSDSLKKLEFQQSEKSKIDLDIIKKNLQKLESPTDTTKK